MSEKNVLGEELALHCQSPKTGFYRDGYCRTGEDDTGSHVVAAIVTQDFLTFTNYWKQADFAEPNKIIFPSHLR